jgi:uncharacterized protein YcbX
MNDLRVTAIYQYPVKSCRGIALDSARLTPYGLERDRHWMVVDRKGRFLTQRRFPAMALIVAELSGDGLVLNAPGMTELTVPPADPGPAVGIRIWGFESVAPDAGDEAAAWFSAYLDFECRLVAPTERLRRVVEPAYEPGGGEIMFADGFPFLLISDASLENLNARLSSPVSMSRFRPNIVVGGCDPHAEDRWRRLRIADALIFRVAKPCSRCTIPNVDPATGARGQEPGATLARYRTGEDGEIYFGQNLVHETRSGTLRVGDPVTVLA